MPTSAYICKRKIHILPIQWEKGMINHILKCALCVWINLPFDRENVCDNPFISDHTHYRHHAVAALKKTTSVRYVPLVVRLPTAHLKGQVCVAILWFVFTKNIYITYTLRAWWWPHIEYVNIVHIIYLSLYVRT